MFSGDSFDLLQRCCCCARTLRCLSPCFACFRFHGWLLCSCWRHARTFENTHHCRSCGRYTHFLYLFVVLSCAKETAQNFPLQDIPFISIPSSGWSFASWLGAMPIKTGLCKREWQRCIIGIYISYIYIYTCVCDFCWMFIQWFWMSLWICCGYIAWWNYILVTRTFTLVGFFL